jgi:pSer/pThr/pTyr-binding forkhead associated (FHA) protein
VALPKGYVILGKQPVVIGRGKDCQVCVLADSVSRRHAQIERRGAGFVISDLGSVNGTTVNGEPVKEPRALEAGDAIVIGQVPFELIQAEGSHEELAARFDPRAEETERVTKTPRPPRPRPPKDT